MRTEPIKPQPTFGGYNSVRELLPTKAGSFLRYIF